MRKVFSALLISLCVFSLYGGALKTGAKVSALPSPLFIDGITRTLGDFLGKKFVVLYIFDMDKEALGEFYKVHDAVRHCRAIADFVGIGTGSAAQLKKFPGVQQLGFPVNADKGEAKKLFLREREKLPLSVVLDKSGTLLWRGSLKALPKILKECESGKFDLKERIRIEAFSDAVNEAIRREKFDVALPMLRREFNANPRKLELLRVQLMILKKLKRVDDAFKLLHDAEKMRPESFRIFEMEYMLIGEYKKMDKLPEFFARLKKNFSRNPGVLLGFALSECKLPPEDLELKYVIDLVETGWRSQAFASDADKGMYALDYAKILHSVGRNDLAAIMARNAQVLLVKNESGRKKADSAFIYYTKMMQIAPTLKLPDLKK